MPTSILQPQTVTNPDQGGTSAVSSASVSGHGSTGTSASVLALPEQGNSGSQSKSCRWSSFQSAPGGQITSLRLKFTYSISGNLTADAAPDGTANANASFSVQYTLDGGSNWITQASDSSSITGNDSDAIGASASADVALSLSQNISQVQVRVFYDASVDAQGGTVNTSGASASISATISGIQIEAIIVTQSAPVIML